MKNDKRPDFVQRQGDAAEARKAILEKFRVAPGPQDPEVLKRQAARQAVQEARSARAAERAAAKQAREQEAKEKLARDAERAKHVEREAAEQTARETSEQAERDLALKAEQKTARDVRYAARKAAKKERRRGY